MQQSENVRPKGYLILMNNNISMNREEYFEEEFNLPDDYGQEEALEDFEADLQKLENVLHEYEQGNITDDEVVRRNLLGARSSYLHMVAAGQQQEGGLEYVLEPMSEDDDRPQSPASQPGNYSSPQSNRKLEEFRERLGSDMPDGIGEANSRYRDVKSEIREELGEEGMSGVPSRRTFGNLEKHRREMRERE
jgi:hypothetical protein